MALSILPPLYSLELPSFTSALITGSPPPSAALHLAISHLSDPTTSKRIPNESTAIFTPLPDLYKTERGSRERSFVDEWIENHGLHGEYAHKLARTHIFTVSTPHQLAAHLALWNCSVNSTPSSKGTLDSGVDPSSTTLIILHDLSLLFPPSPPEGSRNPFLRDVGQGGALLSLVVQVLAWGGPRKPRVAILDSFLDPSSTTHILLRKYVQYTGHISPRSSLSDGAERDEVLGVGEAGSEIGYTCEGDTGKFMLRMRNKEGDELVWGW